jgi:lactoylglutathione lyase
MNTPFQGLRTVIYAVTDVAQAKEWYTRLFKVEPYFDEPFYVGYNIGGYELGLHPADDKMNPKGMVTTTYWGVDDVQCVYEKFIDGGAEAYEPPTDVGGGIIAASVKDPWGNVIGLIYNPYFKLP